MRSGRIGSTAAPPSQVHVVNIYHVIALAFPNSAGFKGTRVLNTLYALEFGADPFDIRSVFGLSPVFWVSSAVLALGGYAGRARKKA